MNHKSSLSTAVIPQPDEKTLRYQLEFNKIFSQRTSMRKELLELESSDRNLTAKIMRKEMIAERIKLIHGDSSLGEKTTSKFEKVISSTRKRQERLKERKAAVELRCQENEVVLQGLNEDVKKTGSVSDSLKDHLQSRQMEIEIRDSRRLIKHIRRFSKHQESHIQSSEKLIASLLTVVRHQYYIIKGSGLASDQVDKDFESVQKQVEGVKEVAWADQSILEGAEVVNTSSEGQEEDNSLNYLLGLPILRCEIQSPRVPTPKNNRRLTFPAKSGSPQVTEHPKSGKSQPTAEITSTPTGVVDSVSSHRNPFATLSTNSPNLGRQQVTLVKSKGIEETVKSGYVEKKTPQHGKVKRVAKENNPRRTAQHPYHRRSSYVLATSTPVRDNKNFEYLRKSGLPSLMDQMSSLKVARQVPSYMTMTKSAAGKRRGETDAKRTLPKRVLSKSHTSGVLQTTAITLSGNNNKSVC
ncbi:hypothetical protein BSL78_29886 [Apostichopus japonicus]|uniref:Coiled-coil domain-containing protein n=1 Tax=Stichopus japonicus TaxID=307972 RepID=A0A2G8JC20_STIJA|nr:hypothetical protein BSL78_29886 [Apostichopus japonicus]